MKHTMDLEAFMLLSSAKTTKSQTLNLNSQSFTIEHNCTDENNCTFLKHSPKKDHNGIYIITHEHKDFGKVDLSHLNHYTKVLSMTHSDYNDGHQKDNRLLDNQKKDKALPQLNNDDDDKIITDKTAKDDLVRQNQQFVDNDLNNRQGKYNEEFRLRAAKKKFQTPQKTEKILNMNEGECIFPTNKANDIESNNKGFESKPNHFLSFGLSTRIDADKPITINDCINTSTPSNYKQLLSKYKTSMTNPNDDTHPHPLKSNKTQMRKMININSRITNSLWDDINNVQNYPKSNKQTYSNSNSNILLNQPSPNKPLSNLSMTSKQPQQNPQSKTIVRPPHFKWWLYYNSIIYPSNSIEESMVKIDKTIAFK